MSGQRPAAAGRSRALVQRFRTAAGSTAAPQRSESSTLSSVATSDIEIPDSDTESEETEETQASQELADDENPGLAPRNWTIVKICDRRDEVFRGVDEFLVRWARTKHPTAEFRVSIERGRLRVKVGDRDWKIVRHKEATPNSQNGEPETEVEWANTWHMAWELSSSVPALTRYERRNPKDPDKIAMNKKPDFRKWPESVQDFLDPEQEPETEDENLIEDDTAFEIEEGIDYTGSLLRFYKEWLRDEARKAPSEIIRLLLSMPVRQRLIFNPEYAANAQEFQGATDLKRRTLVVACAGLAHRVPCTHCANTPPDQRPYRHCISWPLIFAGACVNCVFGGRNYSNFCKCRNGEFRYECCVHDLWANCVRSDIMEEKSSLGSGTRSPRRQRRRGKLIFGRGL